MKNIQYELIINEALRSALEYDIPDEQINEFIEFFGKHIGSDAENDKTTYVTLVGAEKAQKDVETLTASAVEILQNFDNNEFMVALSNYLTTREN